MFSDKGYTRIDAGVSYRAHRGLEFYGTLYNVQDRHDEELLGYPALPLNFMVGFRLTLPAE